MNRLERVERAFADSVELKELMVKTLAPKIADAGQKLAECLKGGGKILVCGNGGSASDAAHFTAELVNRFLVERDGLAAITLNADTALLTAIANDYSYQDIFARQIKALGKAGDMLLAISTSGNSQNVIKAIQMAHGCKMHVVVLSGKDGGAMAGILDASDIELRVPSKITPRIQEVHILVIHCLCELIEAF